MTLPRNGDEGLNGVTSGNDQPPHDKKAFMENAFAAKLAEVKATVATKGHKLTADEAQTLLRDFIENSRLASPLIRRAIRVLITPPKVKKAKQQSRTDRWMSAASDAHAALETLKEVQDEYSEWKDNIEEKFSGSAVYEKLDTICNIDIDSALQAAEEAEGADLPQGFGRD